MAVSQPKLTTLIVWARLILLSQHPGQDATDHLTNHLAALAT
jgi:hypothetical protein